MNRYFELAHPAQLLQNCYNDIRVVASRHFEYVLAHKKCMLLISWILKWNFLLIYLETVLHYAS